MENVWGGVVLAMTWVVDLRSGAGMNVPDVRQDRHCRTRQNNLSPRSLKREGPVSKTFPAIERKTGEDGPYRRDRFPTPHHRNPPGIVLPPIPTSERIYESGAVDRLRNH